MSTLLANLAVAVGVLLVGISMLLLVVGLVSYARLRDRRLLWVSVAFAGFLAQGMWLSIDLYHRRGAIATDGWDTLPALAAVDLGIVLSLYVAVLKQ